MGRGLRAASSRLAAKASWLCSAPSRLGARYQAGSNFCRVYKANRGLLVGYRGADPYNNRSYAWWPGAGPSATLEAAHRDALRFMGVHTNRLWTVASALEVAVCVTVAAVVPGFALMYGLYSASAGVFGAGTGALALRGQDLARARTLANLKQHQARLPRNERPDVETIQFYRNRVDAMRRSWTAQHDRLTARKAQLKERIARGRPGPYRRWAYWRTRQRIKSVDPLMRAAEGILAKLDAPEPSPMARAWNNMRGFLSDLWIEPWPTAPRPVATARWPLGPGLYGAQRWSGGASRNTGRPSAQTVGTRRQTWRSTSQ